MTGDALPGGEPPEGYRFGPRDQRGLLAGIRAGQAGVLVGGLVGAVLVARMLPGSAGVPAAGLVALAGALAGFVPLGGRRLDEWAGPLVAHLRALAEGLGSRGSGSGAGGPAPSSAPARRVVPRVFRGLRVVEVTVPGKDRFGAVEDRRTRVLTGVLAVAGTAFALLERAEQERRVAAWAAALAAVAGGEGAVTRLQWVERTLPGPPLRPSSVTPGGGAPGDSYRDLLRADPGRLDHELLVALSVSAPGRAVGTEGGGRAHARRAVAGAARAAAADAVLARELAALERRLVEAGVEVQGALSLPALCQALRRGFELGPPQGPAPRHPWPVRVEAGWSSARVDRVVQRTYWIAEWPRSEVGPDFLLPLLLAAGERRSVSIVMAPIPARLAVRAVEHARTSGAADAELRARHGFALSARARRQHEAVVQREAELAAGHAAYRFSGYLAVAAPDAGALGRACARLEQAAALSRLALRRLDGHQGEALVVCLPVGRGCT